MNRTDYELVVYEFFILGYTWGMFIKHPLFFRQSRFRTVGLLLTIEKSYPQPGNSCCTPWLELSAAREENCILNTSQLAAWRRSLCSSSIQSKLTHSKCQSSADRSSACDYYALRVSARTTRTRPNMAQSPPSLNRRLPTGKNEHERVWADVDDATERSAGVEVAQPALLSIQFTWPISADSVRKAEAARFFASDKLHGWTDKRNDSYCGVPTSPKCVCVSDECYEKIRSNL